LKAGEIYHRR